MTSVLLINVSNWSCPSACNKGTAFTAALFLILNIRLGWMVSFTPRMLYHQGKITQYLLNKRLGGPWRWSWSFAKEMHIEAGIYLLPFQEMSHNSLEIHHTALSPYLLHHPSYQLICRHNRTYIGRWSSFLPAQADRDSLTRLLIQHPPPITTRKCPITDKNVNIRMHDGAPHLSTGFRKFLNDKHLKW